MVPQRLTCLFEFTCTYLMVILLCKSKFGTAKIEYSFEMGK